MKQRESEREKIQKTVSFAFFFFLQEKHEIKHRGHDLEGIHTHHIGDFPLRELLFHIRSQGQCFTVDECRDQRAHMDAFPVLCVGVEEQKKRRTRTHNKGLRST